VNIAKTGANTNPNPVVDDDGAGVAEDDAEVVLVAEVALVAEVLDLVVPDVAVVAEVAVVDVADVAVVVVAVVAVVADVAEVEEVAEEEEAAQDPEGFLLKVAVYLEQVDLEEHIPVVLILQLPVKYELQLVSTESQRLWQGL